MRSLTYEEVKKTFDERGCVLLSTEYVRSREKLRFVCTCGREGEISFDKFKRGQLCGGCRAERGAEKRRRSVEEVRQVFEDAGCRLLSTEYKTNKDKLKYVCECGTEATIAYSKFLAGQRCAKCKIEKIRQKLSGPNNPFYKHNKSMEERERERSYPEYSAWRTAVFARDEYTCRCCGEEKRTLNAHHIYGYANNPEFRTELWNGITLCEDCHKEYHANFTRNDADEETFFEFMFGEYRDPWYAGEVFDD